MSALRDRWNQLDARMVGFMASTSITLLRTCLGIVFVWFGALKVAGHSPVEALVIQTVPWIDPSLLLPGLGAWEILVGLGLLTRVALRTTLFLFWLQMAGTLLVLLLRPDLAFQHGNPFLLTTEGEFVIKNLVLVSAGIVVGSTVRRDRSAKTS